jgi:hypothetical protein
MNVNVSCKILTLAITICGFFATGCEAPPETSPQWSDHDSALESKLEASQAMTIDALRLRLLESYSLYWPLISTEYQHEQIPAVLSDPLPELRAFGIERVAVLLRDGDASEEELQLVVDHLRDPNPMVRLEAAKLLPEINVPGLSEYVANSLTVENSRLVIEEELSFFRTRPNSKAIEPTIALLTFTPVDSAAKTLIVLLDTNPISDETKRRIVQTVQRTRRVNDSPSLITLEAMLGNQGVKRKLVHLLRHPNKEIRIAVAKGFASSGYAQPLIDRANNPELYEYALIALQKRIGIESFKQLMELYQPENEQWNLAAFAVATTLDTSSLLRADDMLKRIEMNELRLLILNSVWENADEKSPAARKAIARRAVPLMNSTGDDAGTLQLLDGVELFPIFDEDLISWQFAAAISVAAWDVAADARPVPEPWIDAWQSLKDTDPTAATVIRQQITLRFKNQLTEQQREFLGVVQVDATPDQDPS